MISPSTPGGSSGDFEGSDRELRRLQQAYQSGEAEQCAIAHFNLAAELQETSDADDLQSHLTAAALLFYQLGSPHLEQAVAALAVQELPSHPPSLEALGEQIAEVDFPALFAGLPQVHGAGEQALAAIWQQVRQQQLARGGAVDQLPNSLREAAKSGDRESFRAAVAELSLEETGETLRLLYEAGVLSQTEAETIASLRQLDELLRQIARAAVGDDSSRDRLLAALEPLEAHGWRLKGPVERIFAGERDADALTAGLDAQDRRAVERILALIAE